jgi:PAS domain S-box-containing protein
VALHAETKATLAEADAALAAVRASAVDALVAGSGADLEVLTLVEDGDRFFRTLVAAMQEGAASLDAGGTVLYANRRLAELLGLPLERVVGRALAELAADASGPRVERLLAQATRGPARAALELVAGDGRHVPVTVSAAPLAEEGGELCLLVTDLSVQRRAEAELGRAEAKLEAQQLLRNRALDLNDDVIQQLVLALMELRGGNSDGLEGRLTTTLDRVRDIVTQLLADQALEPGHLRRIPTTGE